MKCAPEKLLVIVSVAMLSMACVGTTEVEDASLDLGLTSEALEGTCLFVNADASAELGPRAPNGREILTRHPFIESTAQSYGSFGCSGFVGDFTNPNGHNINRITVVAGGWVETPADYAVFGTEALCANLTLEADVYGYRNGIATSLGSIVDNGELRPRDDGEGLIDRCHLSYQLVQPGVYEAVRIIGRVSNAVATYPFRLHVG